jgi:hypothetical protein
MNQRLKQTFALLFSFLSRSVLAFKCWNYSSKPACREPYQDSPVDWIGAIEPSLQRPSWVIARAEHTSRHTTIGAGAELSHPSIDQTDAAFLV